MKITQQFQVVSSCLLCLPRLPARGTKRCKKRFNNDNQSSCRNLQNLAEQEQPLSDCLSQKFNKIDSYHNLFFLFPVERPAGRGHLVRFLRDRSSSPVITLGWLVLARVVLSSSCHLPRSYRRSTRTPSSSTY
ncbi:hypothetical protein T06_10891 [Trichinella sp. T6]|nr:hypothetical protein T06_10891 [Trichinella sp. T6]